MTPDRIAGAAAWGRLEPSVDARCAVAALAGDRSISFHGASCSAGERPDRGLLLCRAREEYAFAGRRREVLGPALALDPAWNILLDLMISDGVGRRLSVGAACIGSRAPAATASRYVALLADARLVERAADEKDGRRSFLKLTAHGWDRMGALLG